MRRGSIRMPRIFDDFSRPRFERPSGSTVFQAQANSGKKVLCFTVKLNQTLLWESQKKISQTESISQCEDIIRTAFTKSILFPLIAT